MRSPFDRKFGHTRFDIIPAHVEGGGEGGGEKRERDGVEEKERNGRVHRRRENYYVLSTSIATRIRALWAP